MTDDQVRALARYTLGGWTELPYTRPDQPITERDVAAGLHAQVWAYAILGEGEFLDMAGRMIDWIMDWQQAPLDEFPADGTLRHSIARHENASAPYPGDNVAVDRGYSPWMSALVGAELYYYDIVFGGNAGKAIVADLSRGVMSAYRNEPEARRRAMGPDDNPYQCYLCAPYADLSDWPDDYLGWFADLHTPDSWLLHTYASNAEGAEIVKRWFTSDAGQSSRAIGATWKRAFGWKFKNGTAPLLLNTE